MMLNLKLKEWEPDLWDFGLERREENTENAFTCITSPVETLP